MIGRQRAQENQNYVRKLLKQNQPEFAAILERAVRELSFSRTQFTGRTGYAADIKVPNSLDVVLAVGPSRPGAWELQGSSS